MFLRVTHLKKSDPDLEHLLYEVVVFSEYAGLQLAA